MKHSLLSVRTLAFLCFVGFCRGETKALKEIFIGRCNEYQSVLQPQLFDRRVDCNRLWQEFQILALNSSSCNSDFRKYESLVQMTDQRIPKDKFLFWSGIHSMIMKLISTMDYFSMERVLIGYIGNNLNWCNPSCAKPKAWLSRSRRQTVELNEREEDCASHTIPFWEAASGWLAKKAEGTVSVLLNGSAEEPFRESSIFGSFELPHLKPPRVPRVRILMQRELRDSRASGVSCRDRSVRLLMRKLRNQGVLPECEEDPGFVLHVQCASEPSSDRCRLINSSTNSLHSAAGTAAVAAAAAAVTAALSWLLSA